MIATRNDETPWDRAQRQELDRVGGLGCSRCGYEWRENCTDTPCRFNPNHAAWPLGVEGPCVHPEQCGEFSNQCGVCLDEARQMSDRSVKKAQMEDLARNLSKIKPKQLKCLTCGMYVAYEQETIALTVDTCKNKFRTDHHACYIQNLMSFVKRLDNVIPLRNQSCALLSKPTTTVVVTSPLKFKVDDPVVIFVAKNGNVERR